METLSPDAALRTVLELAGQGANEEAFALATSIESGPERTAAHVSYMRSCLAVRLGDVELGLEILAQAVANGWWYGREFLYQSPSWEPLQGLPQFVALAQTCERRQDLARSDAAPATLVTGAENGVRSPTGLVMALHGNYQDASAAREAWPTPSDGWVLALPQSRQAEATSMAVWNDTDSAMTQLGSEFGEIAAKYSIDPDRVLIAGFSMGAEMALRAALSGVVPARRFLLIAPGGSGFETPGTWQPYLAGSTGGAVRPTGHVIVGRDDRPERAEAVIQELRDGGISCSITVVEDLGHAYPPTFRSDVESTLVAMDAAPQSVATWSRD